MVSGGVVVAGGMVTGFAANGIGGVFGLSSLDRGREGVVGLVVNGVPICDAGKMNSKFPESPDDNLSGSVLVYVV